MQYHLQSKVVVAAIDNQKKEYKEKIKKVLVRKQRHRGGSDVGGDNGSDAWDQKTKLLGSMMKKMNRDERNVTARAKMNTSVLFRVKEMVVYIT